MGNNNWGLQSREPHKAVLFGLKALARQGLIAEASAVLIAGRAKIGLGWMRQQHGVKWLEQIERRHVVGYGRALAEACRRGEIAASTAHDRLSAVNSVMRLLSPQRGRWRPVSAIQDCGIPARDHIRREPPGALDREAYGRALAAIQARQGDRVAAVVALCRELGLRSREASCLDARAALDQARGEGRVRITAGTKGGRPRDVPITSGRQLEALARAAEAQGEDRSMIPRGVSWRDWREGELRQARETVREETGAALHDLRAAYACERYSELTGSQPPVVTGESPEDRDLDHEARERISAELGHGRVDVVAQYIGGRR